MERKVNAPKLIFRRSRLYDKVLIRDKKFKISPENERLNTFLKKIEKEWKKDGTKILKEISRITKLPWHEKEIVCYITWGVKSYSDPLTLNPVSDIHTLTHELIHRILSEPENWKKIKLNWMRLMRKYQAEPQVTKTHIVVHSIHAVLLKKLFSARMIQKQKKATKSPQYIRSWEIAEREGYGNILAELFKNKTTSLKT